MKLTYEEILDLYENLKEQIEYYEQELQDHTDFKLSAHRGSYPPGGFEQILHTSGKSLKKARKTIFKTVRTFLKRHR